MSEDHKEYDQKYVTQLREEAASWRVKYKELEAQTMYKDVEVEFARRGIQADPTWVELKEGMSIQEGVDALVSKHPNLVAPSEYSAPSAPEVVRPQAPRVIKAGPAHPDSPANPFHTRSIQEIKKDPVARSKLRDIYRAALANSSNQPDHSY